MVNPLTESDVEYTAERERRGLDTNARGQAA